MDAHLSQRPYSTTSSQSPEETQIAISKLAFQSLSDIRNTNKQLHQSKPEQRLIRDHWCAGWEGKPQGRSSDCTCSACPSLPWIELVNYSRRLRLHRFRTACGLEGCQVGCDDIILLLEWNLIENTKAWCWVPVQTMAFSNPLQSLLFHSLWPSFSLTEEISETNLLWPKHATVMQENTNMYVLSRKYGISLQIWKQYVNPL